MFEHIYVKRTCISSAHPHDIDALTSNHIRFLQDLFRIGHLPYLPPQRGMNTKHTHTQEHLLNPPNMKHVKHVIGNSPQTGPVSLWSLSAGKPWSPS